MGIRRSVGQGLDGSNVTITLGKIECPAISAKYGDKLEPGKLSYMGGQQVDEMTQGSYSIEDPEIVVSSVIFRSVIMPAMPKSGGGNVRLPVVVSFDHPDLGSDSDLIEGARIVNWSQAVSNSNTAFEVPLKLAATQIRWTDDRKTINQLRGEPPNGAHGF